MGAHGSVDEGARFNCGDGHHEDFPAGAACEEIPCAKKSGKLKDSTPKKAELILDSSGAMPVYMEFVEKLQHAHSTGLFATWKKDDFKAIFEEFDPKFKATGVEVVACRRGFYNAGSKTSGEDWWFVYIDRSKLPDYMPNHRWCAIMGEECE